MNIFMATGRLTRDPEVRYTTGENPVCVATFNLAIDRYGKDGADFPRIKAIGKLGQTAEKYLHKGSKVLVQGRLETGSYERKIPNTNKTQIVYYTEIVADKIEFLDGKQKENENVQPPKADDYGSGFQALSEDDIPY